MLHTNQGAQEFLRPLALLRGSASVAELEDSDNRIWSFKVSCEDGHFRHGSQFAFGGSDGHGFWQLGEEPGDSSRCVTS